MKKKKKKKRMIHEGMINTVSQSVSGTLFILLEPLLNTAWIEKVYGPWLMERATHMGRGRGSTHPTFFHLRTASLT